MTIIARIDVWQDYCGEYAYSISACDQDGAEINCVGGDDDLDAAFAAACEIADREGVPAAAIYDSGEIMSGYYYEPETE